MKTYKLEFYVPEESAESVKNSVLEVGAGRIDNYDFCCWQTTSGVGQFRPLEGSSPYIGQLKKIEKVNEVKVELICSENFIFKAITALKKSHPYEVPAFQYWEVNIS